MNLIHDPMPNITFLRFEIHNNPHSPPQQSLVSFSNMDDIETHVRRVEKEHVQSHLTVIDIPLSEKRSVLAELRLMGITPGSLFPDLDGVCRALREQHFDSE